MDNEVVIIGAGISGIGSAIMFNKNRIDDLVILERKDDIGGTWRDNNYPGIAVDIPSFVYQFSFEPNPRWSKMFAGGAEIQEYIRHCVKKYDIEKYIRYNTKVESIVFNKGDNTWTTTLTDQSTIVSRYVIGATGILYDPIKPKIEGQDDFKGESRHTIDWDDTFNIKNKKVGIIGSGATAVQVVPAIAPDVDHLTVFQRTPIWLSPKPDYLFTEAKKKEWAENPIKYKRKQARTALWIQGASWLMLNHHRLGNSWKKIAEKDPRYNLKKQIPSDPELRKKLTPDYVMGCKRPAISSDYFKTFTRDNVSLETGGIQKITETGIKTKDGKDIPLDVIIYSTGFKTTEKGNFPNFKVQGTGPDDLSEFWDKNKFQSFHGVTMPGFPNYFMTSGPFTFGLNWFSMLEDNLHLIIRLMKKAKESGSTLITVDQEAHDRHYKKQQERASKALQLSPACSTSNSYYVDRNGEFSLGAVVSPFYRWVKVRLMGLGGFIFK